MKIFTPKIKEDGTLDFGNEGSEAKWYSFCKFFKDKRVRIELVDSQRTLSQNAFYWFYIGLVAEDTGNDSDDLHEYFKRKFLKMQIGRIKSRSGKVYEVEKYPSTTKLKKHEFSEYLDKISALTGVPIPDPTEAGYIIT